MLTSAFPTPAILTEPFARTPMGPTLASAKKVTLEMELPAMVNLKYVQFCMFMNKNHLFLLTQPLVHLLAPSKYCLLITVFVLEPYITVFVSLIIFFLISIYNSQVTW